MRRCSVLTLRFLGHANDGRVYHGVVTMARMVKTFAGRVGYDIR